MPSDIRMDVTHLVIRNLRAREIEEFLEIVEECDLTFAPTDSKTSYLRALEYGVDFVLVAEYEKKIVGGVVIKYSPLWSIISHLCVTQSFRGFGIASELIEAAESKIEELGGTKSIAAYIECDNLTSIKLVKKGGYTTWPSPIYCVYKEV